MKATCTCCNRVKCIHARHMCRPCYDAATGNLRGSEGERIKSLTPAQIEANIARIVAASEANGGMPPGRSWEDEHVLRLRRGVKVRRVG